MDKTQTIAATNPPLEINLSPTNQATAAAIEVTIICLIQYLRLIMARLKFLNKYVPFKVVEKWGDNFIGVDYETAEFFPWTGKLIRYAWVAPFRPATPRIS